MKYRMKHSAGRIREYFSRKSCGLNSSFTSLTSLLPLPQGLVYD
jgi:hypothetical protein